ncbi:putative homing endonuclease [Enterobacter phage EC-W2]|nr:putative homing endonuclease [Cronobacter phage vB_CsaM_Cronuts]URP85836.1 putative homing endonuclease [Enterobacter phage EC-W2]
MKVYGKTERTISEEIDVINEFLNYVDVDVEKGEIFWKTPTTNRMKVGDPCGTNVGGYTQILFNKFRLRRHRVIFYVVKGYLPLIVDHIHGVERGDGIDNLQELSHQNNCIKKKSMKSNTSGCIGVSFMKSRGKYKAYIVTPEKKNKHLGLFETFEEAKRARESAFSEMYPQLVNK